MFDATQQDVCLGLAHMFNATQQDVSCGGGVGWGGHASGQQLPKGRSERKLSGSIFGVDSGVASLKAMCSPTSASCANKTDQKGRKKKKKRTLVDHRCKYIANNNEFEKKAPFEARVSGFLPTLTSKLQVIYARIPYVFPHFIQKS